MTRVPKSATKKQRGPSIPGPLSRSSIPDPSPDIVRKNSLFKNFFHFCQFIYNFFSNLHESGGLIPENLLQPLYIDDSSFWKGPRLPKPSMPSAFAEYKCRSNSNDSVVGLHCVFAFGHDCICGGSNNRTLQTVQMLASGAVGLAMRRTTGAWVNCLRGAEPALRDCQAK